jgi:thiol:disulfide interchange protein DsbA
VVFKRVPVPFLYNADNFAHTYYALDTMGLVDKLQMKIFSAVHVDHLRLDKPEDIAAVVGKNGGDAAKFLAAFKSFSVATAVSRSKKMTADYKVDAVPMLAIQGRFITSPEQAHGGPQSLAVTDALIQLSRKA